MLKKAIRNEFLSTLLGLDLWEQEKDVLCRPTCFAGIGILDPVQKALGQHSNSRAATESIILALKYGTTLDVNGYQANSRM